MGLQTYTEQQASKSGDRGMSAPEDEEESSSAQLQPQSWSECGEDEEELQCELELNLDDEGEADSEADNEAAEEAVDLREERGSEGADIIERAEQGDDGDVQSVLELCLDDDDEEEGEDDNSIEEERELTRAEPATVLQTVQLGVPYFLCLLSTGTGKVRHGFADR